MLKLLYRHKDYLNKDIRLKLWELFALYDVVYGDTVYWPGIRQQERHAGKTTKLLFNIHVAFGNSITFQKAFVIRTD